MDGLHTFAEAYSALNGKGVKVHGDLFKLRPKDAALVLKETKKKLSIVDLDEQDIFSALDSAEKLGVQGASIHDLMHAVAADKIKADIFLTRNKPDFVDRTAAKIQRP